MKTIKEVAETVNVSKTSIYNLIKRHNIPTFRREGRTFLDDSGENLIIGYYSTEQHETISDILSTTKTETGGEGSQDEFQDAFQGGKLLEYTRIIGILEDERGEKNKIIKDLIQSNRILSQALAADKVNETARLMMSGGAREPNTSRGFFSRIFRKK